MKKLKLFFLLVISLFGITAWAQDPPEAVNVHCYDGSITSTRFEDFRNLVFTNDSIIVETVSGIAAQVSMDNVENIIWGEYAVSTATVTFAVVEESLGTIYATVDNVEIASGDQVAIGSSVTFTALPVENAIVKHWIVNEQTIADDGSKTLTTTITESGLTVYVAFEISTAPIVFSVVGDNLGEISATVDNVEIISGDQVSIGSLVTFIALPAESAIVKQWNVNYQSIQDDGTNSLTLTVTDALYVTVEFEAIDALENTYTSQVQVYQNGENGVIKSDIGITTYTIVNTIGQVVYTETLSTPQQTVIFPIDNLISGIYMVNVEMGETQTSKKLIIK